MKTHALIIPKLYNERFGKYTLQNYKYFNGYQMLRDMQDSYAETMQKDFPVLNRGIRFSRAKHITMKKLYGIADNIEKETDIEKLQAKATNAELLQMKANFNDKTLKSFQYQTGKKDEKITELEQTILELLKENNELKKQLVNEPQRVEKVERKRLKI